MIKTILDNFNCAEYIEPFLLCTFILALIISYSSFAPLMYVAIKKQLVDVPDSRSEHSKIVPTLGGVSVFISLVLVMSLAGALLNSRMFLILTGGTTMLFFLGLKDDLIVLSPKKKFLGQLLVSFLLVIITDTRLIGFSNIFSVVELPYVVSVLFTVFVFILIINAYNLIDGVDGLAGSVALCAAIVFGVLFYQTGNNDAATVAFILAGALIPFLRVNFSSKRKMFMGDTGSMIIGFLLAFFAVRFIADSQVNETSIYYNSAPVISIAVLFFPLLDTLRIFIIRIFVLKTSPFQADKNHIHHHLVKLGLNHKKTTAVVVLINALVIVIAFMLVNIEIHFQLALLIVLGTMLFTLPFAIKAKRRVTIKKVVAKKQQLDSV
ncbi:MraY family glycosyltransferase [Pontimicrobium sp. IMCC45349]|jgi:UDP-N-acetylmuramyl pentapeptide phosphotransferase/UDP-N-acetylglucosamine-1-phosphate transferase|uniref:MraY family glycosyltransferase n=1 Tax=Pontimicrobium sp. IMCC45349 TaxID=3391574 RepID=UPI0039A37427